MASAKPGGYNNVRIVVVGDQGAGKSSLIIALAVGIFSHSVPPVVPPTRLPADYYPDKVPLTIVDTSSRPEDRNKVAAECKIADVVVLTHQCDRQETLDRLSTFWLPELRRLEVKVPVIVVCCKSDLKKLPEFNFESQIAPIMHQFPEIETCIECSALQQTQVSEVFYYAQKAVLHPTLPLFDRGTQSLKPRCARALKRIFVLSDQDKDGALNDEELNDFQVKCFNAPLQPKELTDLTEVVQNKIPEGLSDCGLTLSGFLFLHELLIQKGLPETIWTVLRKFDYDNDLKLGDGLLPVAQFKRASDQSVELSNDALDFLKRIFLSFDSDNDGVLELSEAEDLFSTAPENPWKDNAYKDAAERNASDGLALNGFLSQWALMTLLDPINSLANLMYIGYTGDLRSAFHITRRRRIDRKKKYSQRNVFQCFVFGPKGSGKSTLLNAFVGSLSEFWVKLSSKGTVNILVLREMPPDGVASLLSSKDSLAACDVALFMYDSSDENSWQQAYDMLVKVASHGEENGMEIPSLIVAAKDDLHHFPLSVQNTTKVSQDMGIEAPITISMMLGDVSNLVHMIIDAAQHPHLRIPETEAGRNRKLHHRFVSRSLIFASGS
ncbi:Mitochondrial Rho GTPase 1 [Nymphaea thermarum]|nr:Mitochondrial Rho GTPase 1 [Nymphaea thermarum]